MLLLYLLEVASNNTETGDIRLKTIFDKGLEMIKKKKIDTGKMSEFEKIIKNNNIENWSNF